MWVFSATLTDRRAWRDSALMLEQVILWYCIVLATLFGGVVCQLNFEFTLASILEGLGLHWQDFSVPFYSLPSCPLVRKPSLCAFAEEMYSCLSTNVRLMQ
jgi:hypothetical protein